MPAATLLCTNTFSYRHQSAIHGNQDILAFAKNAKWSETSAGFGLKSKVKKSVQLERHYLCDVGRRRLSLTTRASGSGGGGGVDSIIERDDTLRKLKQAILWTVEGVYVLWLFLLPYAPGDPVWAISSETVNDLVGLSLNFFFILPLLNAE